LKEYIKVIITDKKKSCVEMESSGFGPELNEAEKK